MTGPADAQTSTTPAGPAWTARRFFELLGSLGRLRVISQSGPSTFEALCQVGPFALERGFVNAITPDYHWHLALRRFRHVRSHDEVHARSGRRVLSFALREEAGREPFLRIYLHREKDAEFDAAREARFQAAHGALRHGAPIELEAEV